MLCSTSNGILEEHHCFLSKLMWFYPCQQIPSSYKEDNKPFISPGKASHLRFGIRRRLFFLRTFNFYVCPLWNLQTFL